MPAVLSKRTADWLRSAMARDSARGFRPRRLVYASSKDVMPFDCRVSIVYPNGEEDDPETHLFCYVPRSEGWICQGCNGAVQPTVTALTGQSIDADWLDCGEIIRGASAWLFFSVSSSAFTRFGHAAPLFETPQAHIGVTPAYSSLPVPSGRKEAYVLFPHVRIASLTTTGLLSQIFHGIYSTDAQFGDDALNGNGWGASFGIRSLSVSSDDYNGYPGVVALHGFRSPTTISNPYSPGETRPQSDDDILVLLRVMSSDGKTAELKYIPLAELAPADIEIPEPYVPPASLDELIERLPNVCPANHDITIQLGYVWNPCDLYDKNGNLIAAAGWQVARYWPTGGDNTRCNGSSIGNSSGTMVVDLDNLKLLPANGANWETTGNFSALAMLSAGTHVVAHGDLVSLGGAVIVVDSNQNQHTFTPTQLTVNGQTFTVLAASASNQATP